MCEMTEQSKQATWGGRFSAGPDGLMLRIGESVSFDKRLASFDIRGSRAHARMLAHIGLITNQELAEISEGLDVLQARIDAGTFEWSIELEDVHMNIEQALTDLAPAAAKLHTARSRNDQVATDMRLWFKDACQKLLDLVQQQIAALVDLAEKTQSVYIPGYTHFAASTACIDGASFTRLCGNVCT